ncbi:hypothetical protein ACSX1A_17405 [Pontibacter sp. MBLB2868]|uniref:hypothetical protein n=1 Tax=Pontibacter sp. MBLB2868 TaxID=3451555 RepID=UPI003F750407
MIRRTFMLKLSLILTLFLLSLSPQAKAQTEGSIAALDVDFGFRNIKLNTPLEKLPYLLLSRENKYLKFYQKKDENLYINNYPVDYIEYAFEQNKLCAIYIAFNNYASYEAAAGIMYILYGEPQENKRQGQDIFITWRGKKALIATSYNFNSKVGYIAIQTVDFMHRWRRIVDGA